MADLAETVEDLICTFDGRARDTTMDMLALFVFGWILAALFILWLARIIYSKLMANKSKNTLNAIIPVQVEVNDKNRTQKKTITATRPISIRSVGGGESSGGGGGYVPPTPPIRKRLSRQSPSVEIISKVKYVSAPKCTGPESVSVKWVNDVFMWLYNDLVVINDLLSIWLQSMNNYTKKTLTEQGVGVDFIRILPETNSPILSNIFAETDSKDDITITCDCDSTPAFQLKSHRQKGEKIETSHYRVNVNRLRARLNIFCISEKLQFNVKCDGWPEIKIALAPVGSIKNNLDENQLQDVISEIVVNAIRNTEVNFNLAQYSTCPRLNRHFVKQSGYELPVYNDYNKQSTDYVFEEKRLLVKVIRAEQLSGNSDLVEPYCVIEIDEPPQKNQTAIQKNTTSPFWDETFLFELFPNTCEILFEIYDHSTKPNKFLGLGIVGIEELLINHSQRQIISLQNRPYETEPVSGVLTVEFLFIEDADSPEIRNSQPYKIKQVLKSSPLKNSLRLHQQEKSANGISERQNDIDKYHQNTNKATLFIQNIQKQPFERTIKLELSQGSWKEIETNEEEEHFPDEESEREVISNTTANNENNATELDENTSSDMSHIPVESRGRPRKRRDFFGTIKRRLGKRKRAKSAGPFDNLDNDDSLNRSVSADRSHNREGQRLNVPNQKSFDETSRRSSLSETSGLSTASTRTYINEASNLVLETLENGIKRYYLVPISLAQKSKWKKKGLKLHIFNDHTFIAKHLVGGTVCQVCGKNIMRKFGKQGYECRDCLLKCHKPCHVKVNDTCPTSTIHNIELSLLPVLSE